MLSKESVDQIRNNGFLRIPSYLGGYELHKLQREIAEFNEKYYTEANLESGKAYPSDSTDTRTSNAYLIGNGVSSISHIDMTMEDDYPVVDIIHSDWLMALGQLHNCPTDYLIDTTTLLNMQEYKSGSKPVPPHQDGHYLDFDCNEDGSMTVREALVPRYVGVITIYNENLEGTVLTEVDSGIEFRPKSMAGDLIIFDNVRFLHSVPMLSRPRAMVGLRNWHFVPYLYTQTRTGPLKNKVGEFFEGYITEIDQFDAEGYYFDGGSVYEEAPF